MTVIPLYDGSEIGNRLKDKPNAANAGLWYDKFCNQWPDDWGPLKESKRDWIDTVTGVEIGESDEIETIKKRMMKLIEYGSGKALSFKNESRFVTGLGKNHPVENGFTWHHTLGVPYIPGSSVKGIIRDWARQNGIEKSEINRLFGPDDNNERSVGSIIILDALPSRPVSLSSDVMTPHYGPYYSDGKVPGDWHDPTPIPFLVVDTDQEFLFGLVPRNEEAIKDLEMVEKWLIEALEWSGAGAKTNVGYGRFCHMQIKSPAEEWINNISKEQNVERDLIIGKCPNIVLSKWNVINEEDMKKHVSILLKEMIGKKLWTFGGIGSGKKLVRTLKEYLGE